MEKANHVKMYSTFLIHLNPADPDFYNPADPESFSTADSGSCAAVNPG